MKARYFKLTNEVLPSSRIKVDPIELMHEGVLSLSLTLSLALNHYGYLSFDGRELLCDRRMGSCSSGGCLIGRREATRAKWPVRSARRGSAPLSCLASLSPSLSPSQQQHESTAASPNIYSASRRARRCTETETSHQLRASSS